MAKFIYRLQNVLDIKIRLETQAKTEFATAMNLVRTEEEKLMQLVNRRQQYQDDIRKKSLGKVDVVQLRIGGESVKTLDEMMKQQAVKLRIAERNLEKVREQLNEAVKEQKEVGGFAKIKTLIDEKWRQGWLRRRSLRMN